MKKKSSKNSFKILFKYLKNEKFKVFLYILLCIVSYIPELFSAYCVGKALEALLLKEFKVFLYYLIAYEGIFIFCYGIIPLPREYIYSYLELKFIKNVSKDIYDKYQDLPAIAFEEQGVGALINRIYEDPGCVLNLLAELVRLVCKIAVVSIVVIISFMVSIYVGLEIAFFGLIMWFLSAKFFPIIKNTQKNIKSDTDKLVKNVTENLTGIREIKALNIKENMRKKFYHKLEKVSSNSLKIRFQESAFYTSVTIVYHLINFIILLTCGYLFIKGHIIYSVFMMVENYLWRIENVATSLSGFGVKYNKVKISLDRIDEVINNRLYSDEKFGNINLPTIKGIIEFKNVSFKYREEENYTLKNFDIKLMPNCKNAIVGRSGNGKSTIFNLLVRYFDATEGIVTIDGIDIKDLSEKTLRSNLSIIRQSPFIFNMSIIDNFKIIKPSITLKKVRELCQKAYIDDYIMSLPNGYNTIIGEGGVNLSGGQKQRLAIARTLMLDTKIILFDEATSALDNESQKYIKKTINDLVKDHTIIIIAHRLSTIIDSDNIFVVDKGKCVASGSHEKLLNESKIYRDLYKNEELKVD